MLILAMMVGILLLADVSYGATYHVDRDNRNCPGNGTATAPYCSLTALEQSRRLQCGDTVMIHASSSRYDENVTFTAPTCPGAAVVTLTKAPGEAKPTFTTTRQSGEDVAVIRLENLSGWTIEHLRFSDAPGSHSPKSAVYASGGQRSIANITLRHLEVDSFASQATQVSPIALHVGGSARRGYIARNVVIEDNLLTNFRGTGIQLTAAIGGQVSRNTITRGKCSRHQDPQGRIVGRFQGIKITDGATTSQSVSRDNIVRDNDISNLQSVSDCRDDIAGEYATSLAGIWCDVGPLNTVFEGNTVHDTMDGTYDQALRGIFAESRCHNSVIRRNHVYRWGGQAIRVSTNNGTTVENNTLFRTGVPVFVLSGRAHRLYNNICHTVTGNLGCLAIQPEAAAAGGHVIDYNHYYATTGKLGKWGQKPVSTTLAQWQDACNCEARGDDADPLLTNAVASNFRLQPRSPAVNSGRGSGGACHKACDRGALESLH